MKEIFPIPQVAFAHGIHQNNKTTSRQPGSQEEGKQGKCSGQRGYLAMLEPMPQSPNIFFLEVFLSQLCFRVFEV